MGYSFDFVGFVLESQKHLLLLFVNVIEVWEGYVDPAIIVVEGSNNIMQLFSMTSDLLKSCLDLLDSNASHSHTFILRLNLFERTQKLVMEPGGFALEFVHGLSQVTQIMSLLLDFGVHLKCRLLKGLV